MSIISYESYNQKSFLKE